MHEAVVDVLDVGIVRDGEGQLHDDATGVDVVVEEEGGDARLGLAVDDCPVDGSRTAILGQQGGVDIERAVCGHSPHHFGQHAEGHDHLQVGPVGVQLLHESGVFHLLRLEDGQPMLKGILLYGRWLEHASVTAYGLVGLGDHRHHVITVVN